MTWPSERAFTAIRRVLPAELLPEKAAARIEAICRAIQIGDRAGIEVRLAETSGQVDFGLQLDRQAHSEGAGLGGFLSAIDRLGFDNPDFPAWSRLAGFLSTAHTRRAAPAVRNEPKSHEGFWLEFDLDGRTPVPAPGIFVAEMGNDMGTWKEMAAQLRGSAFSSNVEAAIEKRLALLDGQDERVMCYGYMLSRPVEAMRVLIAARTPKHFLSWAEKAGWPGRVDTLQPILDKLLVWGDQLFYNVDLSDHFLPKIGVEIYFQGPDDSCYQRRKDLVDHWCENDLASPVKAAALMKWPSPPPASELERMRNLFGTNGPHRMINHLKLTINPDGPVEAKAYLAYQPVVLPGQS